MGPLRGISLDQHFLNVVLMEQVSQRHHVMPHLALVTINMSRKLIWLGAGVGGTIGGLIPTIWGADFLSISSIVLSTVGGLFGIWAAFKLGSY